jgi:translation initiation factor IF-2
MPKVKVEEIALELGITNKEAISKANELGLNVKVASSSIDESMAEVVVDYIMTGNIPESMKNEKNSPELPTKIEEKKEVVAPETKKSDEEQKSLKVEDEIKKEDPPKEQVELKPTDVKVKEKESLSHHKMVRQGFRIVRKNSTAKEESKVAKAKKIKTSVQELLGENSISDLPDSFKKKPVKKKIKKISSQNKSATKLSIQKSFSDIVVERNNEVVLVDLNEDEKLDEIKREFEKKTSVNKPNVYMAGRPARPSGRRRSRSRSKYKKLKVLNNVTGEIIITEDIRVYEFAEKTNKTISEIITIFFKMGMMVTKNDFLDKDLIEILADELELSVVVKDSEVAELDYDDGIVDEVKDENMEKRAPIVTIMGHVDHGKTSLLDKIRDTKVTEGESGGITQHIGAYTTNTNGYEVTFIDTPGHEAFSQMRVNGASVTDIVIVVVAADDGVKPQTKEAVSHAKNANVPIIVAVNKIDKDSANVDLVKSQMAEIGVTANDWGGDVEFVNVSALSGEGIPNLLEIISIQADLMELKANPNKNAKATVIESCVKKGIGSVATVIIEDGTLKIGDSIIIDTIFGKVRTITNDIGENVSQITPSQAGEISGLEDGPIPGSKLISLDNEKEAKDIANKRKEHNRVKELSKSTKVSLDELSALVADGKLKSLPIIIKADTQGSLEAIKVSLAKLKNDEVKINIVHSGIGGITKSDLELVKTTQNAIILGFNIRPTGSVNKQAKSQDIEIKTYSIIYNLIDDIRFLISGMMSPIVSEENTGQAEVKDTFAVSKIGTIAGCLVADGTIIKGGLARVIRDGVVIQDNSKISSLKRFKDDAKEVSKGYECGIMLDGFNDIKVGDVIETFKEIKKQVEIKDN